MIDLFWDVILFFEHGIQFICEFLTNHRFRILEGWTEKLETDPDDYKPEYYWRCRICRKTFWNYGEDEHDKRNILLQKEKS